MYGRTRQDGQAAVELLAGIPALVLAGLIALQLLAVGYAATLLDGAVEAGAIAAAQGRPVEQAVRAGLPGWARERVEAESSGGRITVTVRPPTLLEPVARALELESSAWVRPAS